MNMKSGEVLEYDKEIRIEEMGFLTMIEDTDVEMIKQTPFDQGDIGPLFPSVIWSGQVTKIKISLSETQTQLIFDTVKENLVWLSFTGEEAEDFTFSFPHQKDEQTPIIENNQKENNSFSPLEENDSKNSPSSFENLNSIFSISSDNMHSKKKKGRESPNPSKFKKISHHYDSEDSNSENTSTLEEEYCEEIDLITSKSLSNSGSLFKKRSKSISKMGVFGSASEEEKVKPKSVGGKLFDSSGSNFQRSLTPNHFLKEISTVKEKIKIENEKEEEENVGQNNFKMKGFCLKLENITVELLKGNGKNENGEILSFAVFEFDKLGMETNEDSHGYSLSTYHFESLTVKDKRHYAKNKFENVLSPKGKTLQQLTLKQVVHTNGDTEFVMFLDHPRIILLPEAIYDLWDFVWPLFQNFLSCWSTYSSFDASQIKQQRVLSYKNKLLKSKKPYSPSHSPHSSTSPHSNASPQKHNSKSSEPRTEWEFKATFFFFF